MIRPITVICWLLALGSGLYLYRAKHEVELMDQHIDQIAKQTEDLRLQSRQLLDDWIRLGEPEQLHKYSDEYLGLKTIAPPQFARLSDLPNRLPQAQTGQPEQTPDVVAQSSDAPAAATVASDAALAGGSGLNVRAVDPAAGDADHVSEADVTGLPPPPPRPVERPPAAAVLLPAAAALPVQAKPVPADRPPVTATAVPSATALPLQAKPVTPRSPVAQADAAEPRPHPPAHLADDPRAADPKAPPTTAASRDAPAGVTAAPLAPPASPPASPVSWPTRGLPPLQAQGPRNLGLPPVQAQGPAQGSGYGQPTRPPAYRPAASWQTEPRIADGGNDQQREVRAVQPPGQPQPRPAMTMAPRGPEIPQYPPQYQQRTPPPAQAPGGSLLGIAHGSVPLPLPAPTPVSATWSGASGSSPIAPGR